MDSKKKRNRKKKGNQGKNNEETASNAEDVVVQEHNHDLTTEQNHDSLSQQNHHGQNSSNVDVQNAVVSESEMELEKHKYYEAEFVISFHLLDISTNTKFFLFGNFLDEYIGNLSTNQSFFFTNFMLQNHGPLCTY